MKTKLLTLLVAVASSGAVLAAPQSFDFKDPKGVNNATFKMDAPLEAITGSASGISGTVTFDPENPAATKGKIVIAAESLTVPNSTMKGHMHSEQWLDVAKNPEISFDVKELKNVKSESGVTSADAVGTLSVKGVSKAETIPVKLTYLKDKLGQRVPQLKGDLLVIRSNFKIKRSEFNIKPGQAEDKVANEIDVNLSIAGASPQ